MNLENHKARSRRGLLKAAGAAAGAGLGVGSVVDEVASVEGSEAGEELWSFDTGSRVYSSPTVVNDRIYVGSSNDSLYCLNKKGELLWTYDAGAPVVLSSPVVVDGTVYIGSGSSLTEGNPGFAAVNTETGEEIYKLTEDDTGILSSEYIGGVVTSPAVYDGKVYFGSTETNRYYAVDAVTGEIRWRTREFEQRPNGSPVVEDGVLFLRQGHDGGSGDVGLYAYEPETGQEIWGTRHGPYRREISPTVHDGRLYIPEGVTKRGLAAVDVEDGSHLWRNRLGRMIESTPTAHQDHVYITAMGNPDRLYALDKETGEIEWEVKGVERLCSPTVTSDYVITGASEGGISGFDREDGERKWHSDAENISNSSPTVVDGTAYVGCGTSIYAFDTDTQDDSTGSRIQQGILGHHQTYAEQRSTEETQGSEGLPGFTISTATTAALGALLWRKHQRDKNKKNKK